MKMRQHPQESQIHIVDTGYHFCVIEIDARAIKALPQRPQLRQ